MGEDEPVIVEHESRAVERAGGLVEELRKLIDLNSGGEEAEIVAARMDRVAHVHQGVIGRLRAHHLAPEQAGLRPGGIEGGADHRHGAHVDQRDVDALRAAQGAEHAAVGVNEHQGSHLGRGRKRPGDELGEVVALRVDAAGFDLLRQVEKLILGRPKVELDAAAQLLQDGLGLVAQEIDGVSVGAPHAERQDAGNREENQPAEAKREAARQAHFERGRGRGGTRPASRPGFRCRPSDDEFAFRHCHSIA